MSFQNILNNAILKKSLIIIFQYQNKNKLNPLNLKVYTNGNLKHKSSNLIPLIS